MVTRVLLRFDTWFKSTWTLADIPGNRFNLAGQGKVRVKQRQRANDYRYTLPFRLSQVISITSLRLEMLSQHVQQNELELEVYATWFFLLSAPEKY
jgi:hypothetical protein